MQLLELLSSQFFSPEFVDNTLLIWTWNSQVLTWPAGLSFHSLTWGSGLLLLHRAAASRGPGRRPCCLLHWRTTRPVPAQQGCLCHWSCHSATAPKLQVLQRMKPVICKEPFAVVQSLSRVWSPWPHGLQHTRLLILHCLPEFAQTHVPWVSDANVHYLDFPRIIFSAIVVRGESLGQRCK